MLRVVAVNADLVIDVVVLHCVDQRLNEHAVDLEPREVVCRVLLWDGLPEGGLVEEVAGLFGCFLLLRLRLLPLILLVINLLLLKWTWSSWCSIVLSTKLAWRAAALRSMFFHPCLVFIHSQLLIFWLTVTFIDKQDLAIELVCNV